MSRVSTIISRVRDSLADNAKTRFTDARLISLLNEAQMQVATSTKVLRTSIVVAVTPLTSIIQLPNDCISTLRVEYDGVKLALKSHDEMDKIDPNWKQRTADVPTTVIYDLRDLTMLQLWPALNYASLEPFGLVSTLTGATIATPFGVAESLTGSVAVGELDYGLLGTIQIATPSLSVQYAKAPVTITSIDEDPEVPHIFDIALKSYTIGMALRDNMDLQNRQVGQEWLAQAGAEVKVAMRLLSGDYTAMTQYTTEYNGGI